MKKPIGAIEEIQKSIRPLDGERIECGVNWQALDDVLKWAEWSYNRIVKLEKEVDDLESELVDPYDDEDELEPKGDQW